MYKFSISCLMALATAFTYGFAQTPPEYDFIPMDTGNFSSRANSINESGLIGGSRTTANNPNGLNPAESYLWQDGQIIWSGHLGGNLSGVSHVNNQSMVVGQARIASPPFNGNNCGFRMDIEFLDMQPLQPLSVFEYNSVNYVYGLNDKGIAAGNSRISDDELNDGEDPFNAYHAVLWTLDDEVIDLGTLGAGYSRAFAVNNQEEVAGSAVPQNGDILHAVRWRKVGQSFMIEDLHDIPDCNFSDGLDINENGTILGEAFLSNGQNRVVTWDSLNNTNVLELAGGDNCFAGSINNEGAIVGHCQVFESGNRVDKAYLYQNGNFYFLEDIVDDGNADRSFEKAYDINDQGWIVGRSILETSSGSKNESYFIRPKGDLSSTNHTPNSTFSAITISPNPGYGQEVIISFQSRATAVVQTRIFDAIGCVVADLPQQNTISNQSYSIQWQPSPSIASGRYYINLRSQDGSSVTLPYELIK